MPEAAAQHRQSQVESSREGGERSGSNGSASFARGPLEVLTLDRILTRPSRDWLTPGVLPKRGLGLIFGPSSSGKSFVALDLLLRTAAGLPWAGRPIEPCIGIYVVTEGGAGISDRAAAWMNRHGGSSSIPFGVIDDRIRLGDERLSFEHLRQAIAEFQRALGCRIGLIVVDTLARTIGGDENSQKDVGRYLNDMEELVAEFDCLVLVVHHAGHHAKRRPRGASALTAAVDVELEVRRINKSRLLVRLTKLRDGEAGSEWVVELETVRLADTVVHRKFGGTVQQGPKSSLNAATSCVLGELQAAKLSDSPQRKSANRPQKLLLAFQKSEKARREMVPVGGMRVPRLILGRTDARAIAMRSGLYSGNTDDSFRTTYGRDIAALVEADQLVHEGEDFLLKPPDN